MRSSRSPSSGNHNDRTRLTETQKKYNHIRSEQKRRVAIREGFDRLASIVPGMQGQGRSEAVVLHATLQFLREEICKRQELIAQAQAKGVDTDGWELDPLTVTRCDEQMERIQNNQNSQANQASQANQNNQGDQVPQPQPQ